MRQLVLGFAAVSAVFVGFALEGCRDQCVVGAEGCDCTAGGACDAGLQCLSKTCVNAGPNFDAGSDGDDDTSGNTSNDDSTTSPGDGDSGDGDAGDGDAGDGDGDAGDGDTTGGIKLDTLDDSDGRPCIEVGCKKVDLLFALDGSASMTAEINALTAEGAFLDIVSTLENLNCGGIDYRIGVTGDNDNGWIIPNNWVSPNPWFDSDELTPLDISVHFQAAAMKVASSGGAPLGCEHVLSSAVGLLDGDTSGFLRDDALLVLVFVTDVDDYGAYDQLGGNTCGIGCGTPGQPVQALQDTLVALKGGDTAGLATIVVAGDPMVNAGVNICGQPQSCGAPIQAFHAERLYEFAMLQGGMNGFTADICAGPAAVPEAVQAALADNIDLACQEFEPEG